MTAQPFNARVIAVHGRHFRVRTDAGATLAARPARRELKPVCGDTVRCIEAEAGEPCLIEALEPRHTSLQRTDSRGRAELLAANVSLLLVVIAPVPRPDFFVVDRYLCAATCSGLHAALIFNKCELDAEAAVFEELEALAAAGYPWWRCSAHTGEGMSELRARLRPERSILVGQSGVGKSALLAALVPDSGALTGALDRDAAGRHTTTASTLYALAGGGDLIDSPGVRDFAPAIERLDARSMGFPEIERFAAGCRFQDCRHLKEPQCAVQAAVASGAFSARRYESYRRLRRLHERLQPPPGRGR